MWSLISRRFDSVACECLCVCVLCVGIELYTYSIIVHFWLWCCCCCGRYFCFIITIIIGYCRRTLALWLLLAYYDCWYILSTFNLFIVFISDKNTLACHYCGGCVSVWFLFQCLRQVSICYAVGFERNKQKRTSEAIRGHSHNIHSYASETQW